MGMRYEAIIQISVTLLSYRDSSAYRATGIYRKYLVDSDFYLTADKPDQFLV
jgi:hypothetical protein